MKVADKAYTLDDKCFEDYASKLIPRAVGYSAALLDYFFRGEMQVSVAVPVIQDESVQAFLLVVKNVTPSEETMSDGNFAISVGYTPYCGNSDGSDDMFARSDDVPSGVLQYGQEAALLFSLQEPVPLDLFDSAKCMLAFRGKLGRRGGCGGRQVFSSGKYQIRGRLVQRGRVESIPVSFHGRRQLRQRFHGQLDRRRYFPLEAQHSIYRRRQAKKKRIVSLVR